MSSDNTNVENRQQEPSQSGLFSRFLATVEWLGNLLPHPVTLFALLSVFIVLLSGILGYFDIAVADPRPEGAKGRDADGMIEVISLMSAERTDSNLLCNHWLWNGSNPSVSKCPAAVSRTRS